MPLDEHETNKSTVNKNVRTGWTRSGKLPNPVLEALLDTQKIYRTWHVTVTCETSFLSLFFFLGGGGCFESSDWLKFPQHTPKQSAATGHRASDGATGNAGSNFQCHVHHRRCSGQLEVDYSWGVSCVCEMVKFATFPPKTINPTLFPF